VAEVEWRIREEVVAADPVAAARRRARRKVGWREGKEKGAEGIYRVVVGAGGGPARPNKYFCKVFRKFD